MDSDEVSPNIYTFNGFIDIINVPIKCLLKIGYIINYEILFPLIPRVHTTGDSNL